MVTPAVKSVTLPTMLLAVPSTPRTIVAAKEDPGKVGRVGLKADDCEPVEDARPDLAGRAPAPAVARAHGR